ncbi:hypothetical protein PIB30_108866, partial [Stylosanthes scabra]|nr:hypothetical protein [Stylosanthes scabra]
VSWRGFRDVAAPTTTVEPLYSPPPATVDVVFNPKPADGVCGRQNLQGSNHRRSSLPVTSLAVSLPSSVAGSPVFAVASVLPPRCRPSTR